MAVLVEVERRYGNFEVFNFEVAGQHNYHAAEEALLVHNPIRGPLPLPDKAVLSNPPHAVGRCVERGISSDRATAAEALRDLKKSTTRAGFPAGTLIDTNPDSYRVPIGERDLAVYRCRPGECNPQDRLEREMMMAQRKVEFSMYLDEEAAAYLSLLPVDDVGAETVDRTAVRSVRLVDLVGAYIGPELVFDFNDAGVLLGVEVVGCHGRPTGVHR